MFKNSLLLIAIIVATINATAQTAKQRDVIIASMDKEMVQKSASYIKQFTIENEKKILDYLKNNPERSRTYEENGKPYFLYTITHDGYPIYITTKDAPQQTNIKAKSLYTGGSVGVNITGTDMKAGVWDGGQINGNHETLVGKTTMQPNQALNTKGGNEHQQACTGIIVAKLANNAQGIAHGATADVYDWDKDLAEMEEWSGKGYLVSNHSYGGANDNNTPLWQFGAYDATSKAWDALLKAKLFYLPFIAGGNEQTSSGNKDAKGFDIMTGSSSCKNAVTVGAVNNDNAMSDYSNWGPTDDGRIKPDVVSLGTSIDVAKYDDNTGYTGNTDQSGTSYSAPAVAGGALLLQQYYYSLNKAYMKASMLKALILHSADDDASANGPDAKFGWGIVNLEKAANIIKQNSTTNGNAKMMMITTNPANNGIEEITNNFTFASGGVRASLCWTDDEGTEQTETEGVNKATSRMVYNFSMKLEQVTPALAAFPYNNLSVTNPSVAAVAGTDWFQSANNYIQANLAATTENATGRVKIRKSTTSPVAPREMALIATGLKSNTVTAGISNEKDGSNNILFYDRISESIKMISNNDLIKDFQIYSIDGKLVKSGRTNSNEIEFKGMSKDTYIINYSIKDKNYSLKLINY